MKRRGNINNEKVKTKTFTSQTVSQALAEEVCTARVLAKAI